MDQSLPLAPVLLRVSGIAFCGDVRVKSFQAKVCKGDVLVSAPTASSAASSGNKEMACRSLPTQINSVHRNWKIRCMHLALLTLCVDTNLWSRSSPSPQVNSGSQKVSTVARGDAKSQLLGECLRSAMCSKQLFPLIRSLLLLVLLLFAILGPVLHPLRQRLRSLPSPSGVAIPRRGCQLVLFGKDHISHDSSLCPCPKGPRTRIMGI